MHRQFTQSLALLVLATALTGCVTYHQPRYGQDGVYYDQPYRSAPTRTGYIDPVIYPYWSLDYFYFSRHYTPYSVVVHRHDPWYYPYPGWYYGYRGLAGYGAQLGYGYYPWYSFGIHYRHHRPWKPDYIHYPRPTREPVRYVERPASYQRVREIDQRMRALEQRQRTLAASPARRDDSGRMPVSRASGAGSVRTSTTTSRSERIGSSARIRSTGRQSERPRGTIQRSPPRLRRQETSRLAPAQPGPVPPGHNRAASASSASSRPGPRPSRIFEHARNRLRRAHQAGSARIRRPPRARPRERPSPVLESLRKRAGGAPRLQPLAPGGASRK